MTPELQADMTRDLQALKQEKLARLNALKVLAYKAGKAFESAIISDDWLSYEQARDAMYVALAECHKDVVES